jgi:hypothetical protein
MIMKFTLNCLRCSHQWTRREAHLPRWCPKCHSPHWNSERKKLKHGSLRCPYGKGLEILQKLIAVQTDECIVWPYAKRPQGYGSIWIDHYVYTTHTAAWYLSHNLPIPKERQNLNVDTICICHTCDNRPCINPKHLFKGTYDDNMEDMDKKGRRVLPDARRLEKLTTTQVLEIRASDISTNEKKRELAKQFKVSVSTIYAVHRKRRYLYI